MNYHYFFLILFIVFNGNAQEIIFVDSTSNSPIEYVGIITENSGIYTDEYGRISWDSLPGNTFSTFHIGYFPKQISISDKSDTVRLIPKPISLEEVTVGDQSSILMAKPEKKAKSFGSWVLRPKSEIITILIPQDRAKESRVKSISIPFSKEIGIKSIQGKAILRVSLHNVQENNRGNLLFTSKPIQIQAYSKDRIYIDLSKYDIEFSPNGIALTIELIDYFGAASVAGNSSIYVRPVLTDKNSKYFIATTYLSYFYESTTNKRTIMDILGERHPKYQGVARNLAIGLELAIVKH